MILRAIIYTFSFCILSFSVRAQYLESFDEYFKDSSLGKVQKKESENFSVTWVHPRDAILADAVLVYLEEARKTLKPTFESVMRSKEKAPVEIFPNLKSFSDVSKLSLARFKATGTIALTLEQRLMILTPRNLVQGYSWAETLVHEYIHYLIREISERYVPIWLHEGVAQLFQGYPFIQEAQLKPSQWGLFKRRRENSKLLSLETLKEPFPYRETPEEAELAYIQAMLFAEWLDNKCGVINLIKLAKKNASLEKAVSECSGLKAEELDKAFTDKIMAEVKVPSGSDVEFYARDFSEADPLEKEGRKADKKSRNFAQLSTELFNQGRFRAASIEMEKALQNTPVSPPSWRRHLAKAFLRGGFKKKAEQVLLSIIRDYPSDAASWYYLGVLKLEEKNLDDAWDNFLRAFYINPFMDNLFDQMEQMRGQKPELKTRWLPNKYLVR